VARRRAGRLVPSLSLRQWVHVGDCAQNDVAAAHRFGLRTVLYQPPDGAWPAGRPPRLLAAVWLDRVLLRPTIGFDRGEVS
jgi:hypothetical protein